MNDYELFATSSGSFSRNHDNCIRIARCSLAQDLFIKNISQIPTVHGKHKGVMDIQSTNNIQDKILVSCGNDDDSRILVHNIENQEILFEYKRHKFGFYKINTIIFDNDEDDDFEGDAWKTEGIVIVAAGIRTLTLLVYDFETAKLEVEVDLDVSDDIGSYFNIMKLLRRKNSIDRYNLLVGICNGTLDVFNLKFTFNIGGDILPIPNK